jgi:hypothetical protein
MALEAKPKKEFRITYRREVIVKANSLEEAEEAFQNVGEQELHDESKYVEKISIEEIK